MNNNNFYDYCLEKSFIDKKSNTTKFEKKNIKLFAKCNLATAKSLVESSSEIFDFSYLGNNPLHNGAKNKKEEVFEYLLVEAKKKNINLLVKNKEGFNIADLSLLFHNNKSLMLSVINNVDASLIEYVFEKSKRTNEININNNYLDKNVLNKMKSTACDHNNYLLMAYIARNFNFMANILNSGINELPEWKKQTFNIMAADNESSLDYFCRIILQESYNFKPLMDFIENVEEKNQKENVFNIFLKSLENKFDQTNNESKTSMIRASISSNFYQKYIYETQHDLQSQFSKMANSVYLHSLLNNNLPISSNQRSVNKI